MILNVKKRIFDEIEIRTWGNIDDSDFEHGKEEEQGIALRKSAESDESTSDASDASTDMESSDRGRMVLPNIIRPILNPCQKKRNKKSGISVKS